MSTKCLAYSCVSFGIFQAFKQIMCNSKIGRHYFWYFEIPEAFTLCHEAQHPGRIKLWYSFTVWLPEKAVGALPPATPLSVRVFAYVMEWKASSIGLLQTKNLLLCLLVGLFVLDYMRPSPIENLKLGLTGVQL